MSKLGDRDQGAGGRRSVGGREGIYMDAARVTLGGIKAPPDHALA